MKELFELFTTFMMIGSLTFGGGYAMLPMLTREIVDKRKWATQEELLDFFAIGQCTPGIIAINTATLIGYRRKRVIGALAATLGMVLPSMVIITLIALFLQQFMDVLWIQHAFIGIRIAVCALIANTVLGLLKRTVSTWQKVLMAGIAFAWVGVLGLSPIYATVAFALFGAVYYGRRASV